MNNFTNRLIKKKRFGVFFDDGAHSTLLESFADIDEATEFYNQQIELFRSGTDEFYKQFISDDYDADLEVAWIDEDGCYEDGIVSWSKEDG